jgi:hypothetical protein
MDSRAGDWRYVEVNVDGPSLITVRLSNVSSTTVAVCIIRQDLGGDSACNERNRPVTMLVTDAGPSIWLVSARGRTESVAPTADLSVSFNALSPAATLRNFRYVGTSDPARNGFTAEVTVGADGMIRVQGNFEEDSFTHRVVVDDAGYDKTNGPSNTFETDPDPPVSAGRDYRISVSSPDTVTKPDGAAFMIATITWP